MKTHILLACIISFIPVLIRNGNTSEDTDNWAQVVENADKPVDGHFIVEIEEVSDIRGKQEGIKTTIEYWIRGDNLRFDVKDSVGRDFDSQTVLQSGGERVLINQNRKDASVVVMESSAGSMLGDMERDNWSRFQTLLGRYPFSPLALYQESYHDFLNLTEMGKLEVADAGQVMKFAFDHGVTMKFKFEAANLNPYEVEVANDKGNLITQLRTQWQPFSSSSKLFAQAGELKEFNDDGEVETISTWKHLLAEELSEEENPFTWSALSPMLGKKLIITNSANEESAGGYWDGTEFADTPLRISTSSNLGKFIRWLSVVGLTLGVVFLFFKLFTATRR